jgi:phospholipid methyltransferase
MASWSRIATRFRVPLGFLFAAIYIWLAHPLWLSIAIGSGFILVGLAIRAVASGHIQKNAQLATTGPYAHTRNPLYLGSIFIAVGFIIAARNLWIAVGVLIMFMVIYLPVIRAEEDYLRGAFTGYAEYAARVPRFLPRFTAYRAGTTDGSPVFSRQLYIRHREYNAVLGSALMLGVLILKLIWYRH